MQGAADGFISGMVSGAFAGAMNPSFCFVANAALNTASYCAGQLSSGGDITLGGLGVSAVMGGVSGWIGQSGWMQSTGPKVFASFSGKNAVGHIVGMVGTGNLARLTIPAISSGFLGGAYANISKRSNPTGDFVGF